MNPTSEQKRIAFGYNRHENRIVINEGQAACAKLIFDYYLQGNSLSQIKAILEGLGIPCKSHSHTSEISREAVYESGGILSSQHRTGDAVS
jgi:hypothetical protein